MRASGAALTGIEEEDIEAQYRVVADRLGTADIDGWTIADDLTHSFRSNHDSDEVENIFDNLEVLSFGSWDDGRWREYKAKQSDRDDLSLPNAKSWPAKYVRDILRECLRTLKTPKKLNTCSHTQTSIS
jgi:hypothetical protein